MLTNNSAKLNEATNKNETSKPNSLQLLQPQVTPSPTSSLLSLNDNQQSKYNHLALYQNFEQLANKNHLSLNGTSPSAYPATPYPYQFQQPLTPNFPSSYNYFNSLSLNVNHPQQQFGSNNHLFLNNPNLSALQNNTRSKSLVTTNNLFTPSEQERLDNGFLNLLHAQNKQAP